MAFKLNDVSFNHALLYLRNSQKNLSESLGRISSGKSITKAADNAAGISIANSRESQIRGIGQSMRNATDAIAQIADGVLQNSAEIIMSITINNLSLTLVNVASAQSQIADVDLAEESINLARMKSLVKTGTFAATQAGKMNKQKMSDLLQG